MLNRIRKLFDHWALEYPIATMIGLTAFAMVIAIGISLIITYGILGK